MKSNQDEPLRVESPSGGLNDGRGASILRPGETPAVVNIDFNRDAVESCGGTRKLGNRPARAAGIRTRAPSALPPLQADTDRSVPMRGYGYLPYNERYDIGGDGATDGASIGTEDFAARRGRSFEIRASFSMPKDQKQYHNRPGVKSGAHPDIFPTLASASQTRVLALEELGGYDECLDEVTIILQSGGDRMMPMGWAVGVTNLSNKASYLGFPANGPGSHALVFMWLDAPGWAENSYDSMNYRLDDGLVGAGSANATHAIRAIACPLRLEPGREYSFTVGVQLDSGTPGTPANPTTAWENDGWVQIAVKDDLGNQSFNVFENVGSKATPIWADGGIITHKGPTDSLEYLCKYGLRFTAKLPLFVGLGYRSIPWDRDGFIVYGQDSAALESGGFSMTDLSSRLAPSGWVLSCTRPVLSADVEVSRQYVTSGAVGPMTQNQLLPTSVVWNGLQGNSQALRGYWGAIFDKAAFIPEQIGARFKILDYHESGGKFYLDSDLDTASADVASWSNANYTIYPFRWNQRDMDIGEVRIYSAPQRMSSSSRSVFSLRGQSLLDDSTEPNIKNLLARWSLADAGGTVLVEDVGGDDGYLAPFGVGQSKSGSRNAGQLFLSGEGEALVLDFEKNPVLRREMQNLMRDDEAGLALEMTLILPEPSFAYPSLLSDTYPPFAGVNEYRGKYAPTLARWTLKEEARSGLASTPSPLIELTHSCIWGSANTGFRAPMGFCLLVGAGSDQEGDLQHVATTTWGDPAGSYPGPGEGFYWGRAADWVGKRITIQFGLQPLGGGDYLGYVSCSPRSAFLASAPDSQASEFAIFSLTDGGNQASGTFKISKKDLVRSLITIGGGWAPFSAGYSELNARMILDEVRVFATTGPGGLPALSGDSLEAGKGKLLGDLAMPARALDIADILQDLGDGVTTANVSDGAEVVSPPSGRYFYSAAAEDTVRAVEKSMLVVAGDDFEDYSESGLKEVQEEFYMVDSVTATGDSLSLKTPYSGADRQNARVASFRLIGYLDFTADISDFRLSLGTGKGFRVGALTDEDAILSSAIFFNRAPVSGNWRVRTYSPGASLRDTLPGWSRGVLVPRHNDILGVIGQHDQVYAATQGVLHHVDDRWDYSDGPTDAIERSLHFHHDIGSNGVIYPRADDALIVALTDGLFQDLELFPDSLYTYSIDAWVRLEETGEIQTVLWYGDQDTDPAQLAGATGNATTLWVRINRGYPELVIGSEAAYTGTTRPDRGFYIARAESLLPLDEWVHLRWSIIRDGSAILTPRFFQNGKKVSRVTVNARAAGMSGDQWMAGLAPLTATALYVAMIGAAHDQHQGPVEDRAFVLDVPYGRNLSPNVYHGRIHGLAGKVAAVVASRVAGTAEPENFDPHSAAYSDAKFDLLRIPEERSHKVKEAVRGIYGTIESHPFLSLYHELGGSEDLASWAPYDRRIFVTNGGRPAVIRGNSARSAGLAAPTTAPTFEVQRFPLWKPNLFDADEPKNTPSKTVGPEGFTANHFQTSGNAYLQQEAHTEMRWETDGGTGDWDIFAFKAYLKPRSVSGRISIYSARSGKDSGGVFVEIRDGKLVIGWYDTFLKREVFVETSGRVFHPGYWHFLHVRKHFPRRNGWQTLHTAATPFDGSSNWNNSIYEETLLHAFDVAVVRRFSKAATLPFEDQLWVKAGARAAISFTVDADLSVPAGTNATGMVSTTAATYSTAAPDIINCTSGSPFSLDMVDMLFQWGSGAAASIAGKSYRIVSRPSSTQIQVVDAATGLSPGWSGTEVVSKVGSVFIGTTLIKSDGFDDSEKPDVTLNDASYFGAPESGSVVSGIRPFDGEFDCPCVYVAKTANAQGVGIFQAALADEIETGGETFASRRIDNPGGGGTVVGQLHADGSLVFSSIQTETYASSTPEWSQPNEDLEVVLSSESSIHAQPAKWRHLQPVDQLVGSRRVRVAFFDPERGTEPSNPGPQLLLNPAPEEKSNPSGVVRILLNDLPVSQDSGPIERWVYMTLPNGQEFFRVARIGDNSSTSVAIKKLDSSIINGRVLSYNNPAPPRCGILAVSQNTLFYGRLANQEDGVLYSKPFVPASVPFSNLILLSGGRNDNLTGMINMRGRIVIFKRDRMWRAKIAQGAAIVDEITSGAGATSHAGIASLDDRAYFMGDRGVFVYTGSGLPVWVSPSLERFFLDTVDSRDLNLSSAAVNRARNQFIATVRTPDADFIDQRVSSEFDHAYSGVSFGSKRPAAHRFSRYRSPNILTVGEAQEEGGGRSIIVGGTREGFVVQVDASDQGAMVGDTDAIWGSVELTASGGSTTDTIYLQGTPLIDIVQAGPRGAELRWEKADRTVVRATVLYADTFEQALYLDKPILMADIPTNGTLLVLGSPERRWRSAKFDLAQADSNKRWRHLDLMFEPHGSSGASLTVDVYSDDEATPRVTQIVDPSQPTARIPIGSLHGTQASFELRSTPGKESPRFEMTKFVLRGRSEDQHA